MIVGHYYLHTNGRLIYQRDLDGGGVADLRDSDFVRAFWPVDPDDRASAWRLLVEARALGVTDGVDRLAEKWGCNNSDAPMYAARVGCVVKLDGSAWCAHRKDFANLTESPVGYGPTPLDAMAKLASALGYRAQKLWGASFESLLATPRASAVMDAMLGVDCG